MVVCKLQHHLLHKSHIARCEMMSYKHDFSIPIYYLFSQQTE